MTEYWGRRKTSAYYRIAVELARKHAPSAKSVLDVGSRDCEYINWYDWIPKKVALDKETFTVPGVEMITTDFMAYTPDEPFDLVLCLQVLEHLEEPSIFAKKLFATGSTLVVSVPYNWPPGTEEDHKHDPIDEMMLNSWMGVAPVERVIGDARIIGVYRQKR